MALVGVISDKKGIDVIACQEVHNVFDVIYSFVTLEFEVYIREKAADIILVIHGIVEKNQYKIKGRWIDKIISNYLTDVPYKGGVYEFQGSFFEAGISANEDAYEGPQESIEIPAGGREKSKIKIYGVESNVVSCNYDVRAEEEFSLIKIIPNLGFQGKNTYSFRIGFYLAFPREDEFKFRDKIKKIIANPKIPYDIHYFTFPQEEAEVAYLYRHKIMPAIEKSKLWLRISQRHGIKSIINRISVGEKDYLDIPHSDVWVVILDKWKIEESSFFPEPSKQNLEYTLFGRPLPVTRKKSLYGFNWYHAHLDTHHLYRNKDFIKPQPGSFIKLAIRQRRRDRFANIIKDELLLLTLVYCIGIFAATFTSVDKIIEFLPIPFTDTVVKKIVGVCITFFSALLVYLLVARKVFKIKYSRREKI